MGRLPVVCSAEEPVEWATAVDGSCSTCARTSDTSTLATEVFAAGAAGLVIRGVRRSRLVRHSGRT